jgi:hypothetical protein
MVRSDNIAAATDEYLNPEVRQLCSWLKHKSELTEDETLRLALAAAKATLALY